MPRAPAAALGLVAIGDAPRPAGTIIRSRVIRPGMGGWGKCPCCKAGRDLTEHHDKAVGKKFLLCRECHNVLEEYIRLVGDYKNAGPVQGPPR